MNTIILLFSAALVLRLASLYKSVSNEKKLLKENATEYGRKNSIVLVLAHTFYYISCISEAVLQKNTVSPVSYIGAGLFVFSMMMLWMVIISLGEVWTVKLIIAPQQKVNKSFLFKYFRHPNYFLNIIPELVALALICQAWYTLLIGLPVYLIPLTIRIIQEEKVMKSHFINY